MAYSQQFMDDLGGLGALWAGREQGMQENTTLANQQNTLEQIANSQQNRDIAAQKLPYELADLQAKQALAPELLKEKQLANQSNQQKLDKAKFDDFFEQFQQTIPTLRGTPADGAILAEVAKKHGMDPADPRIRSMIDTASSGNQQAISAMMKRIFEMSSKGQDRIAQEAGANARNAETVRGNIRGHEIAAEASKYAADQRVAAARARVGEVKQTIDQKIAALEEQMANAPAEQKQGYANRITYLNSLKKEIASAAASRRAEDTLTLLENLQRRADSVDVAPSTPTPRPSTTTPPVTGPNAPPPGGTPPVKAPPAVGEVRGGYKFKGGNPAVQANWEKQ